MTSRPPRELSKLELEPPKKPQERTGGPKMAPRPTREFSKLGMRSKRTKTNETLMFWPVNDQGDGGKVNR